MGPTGRRSCGRPSGGALHRWSTRACGRPPSGQVPDPVAERLRDLYHREAIHSVARRELLRAALLRLSDASIPVIVLKGAALAALVYPSPALRPMGDIDLLVHRRDLGRVDELLRGMTEMPRSPTAGSGPDARPGIPLSGAFSLDVRAHIFSPGRSARQLPAAARIPIEDFWERARPAQIESVATLVFSDEDLLLHLALHLMYAGGSCRPREDAVRYRRDVPATRRRDRLESPRRACERLRHREGALPFPVPGPRAGWGARAVPGTRGVEGEPSGSCRSKTG